MNKVSDVVTNEVVKKPVYDELTLKVNAIQTTDARNLIKKLNMTQKLVKLKRKLLIMIIILSILLHNSLIN